MSWRPAGRRPMLPRPHPTKENVGVDAAATLLLLRPRDRKWKDREIWKGTGRHGEGRGIGADDHDEVVEMLDQLVELEDDEADDQGVEGMLLEDPLQRLRL